MRGNDDLTGSAPTQEVLKELMNEQRINALVDRVDQVHRPARFELTKGRYQIHEALGSV
jgi:hypothetical protein